LPGRNNCPLSQSSEFCGLVKKEKNLYFLVLADIRNYPSPKKEETIQTCPCKLNILFDFFKTLNVSLNIKSPANLSIDATLSRAYYFIIKYQILKKIIVYQLYLAYLFHDKNLKRKNF